MEFNPYLTFNGNCAEAMRHYATIFGGDVISMEKYKDAPQSCTAGMSESMAEKVMHAQLRVGHGVIMASDVSPGEYSAPHGIHVQTAFEDLSEATRVFNALADGGTVEMPFEPTFWSAGFGMTRDRFGIPWMVVCQATDVPHASAAA